VKVDDRAFPLYWPEGVPRTESHRRRRAPFKVQLSTARENLVGELRRLGAANRVISTNLSLRPDGLFRIDERRVDDPGVAVYFHHDGANRAMSCDRWDTIAANIQALARTIEALRGIERWGSSEMVARAFRGFTALQPAEHDWRAVFGGYEAHGLAGIRARYRAMAMEAHPDRGGSTEVMARLNAAMEAAERELGGGA
jgi:hypothetical protein